MSDKREKGRPRVHLSQEPYTAEESEYLAAIDAFRRRTGRVPTLAEGFQIAMRLGWRKVQ